MCGGKGGQTGTSNQATQTSIPPEVLQRYNQVYARGEQAANQPFQSYTGDFVAPVTGTQRAGVEQIGAAGGVYQPYVGQALGTLTPSLQGAASSFNNAQGAASPYNQGAAGLIGGSVGASSPLTGQQINQYVNPYTQNVVNATTGWLNQQNQQQQNALTSDAIMSGSFGGDRSGIAKGVLSGQQNLANASTIAGLYNQNYAQGLAAAQQQQGQRVGALQQGAQLTAGLGNQVFGQNIQTGQSLQNLGTQGAQAYSGLGQQAFNNQLQYGQALMGAGTLEQQTQQADLSARYNQFLQQQAYPFQSTQFLSNLATGQGALSGSTSQSYAYQPQPFFSDDELKENVRDIGRTKDGLRIVRYNFKGDDKLRIGFLASDVEKKMPEAVTKHAGVRAVDYERAARARGGVVPHTSDRWPDFDPARLREMNDEDTASQDVADPGMGVVRGVQEGRSLGDILSRTRGFGGPEGTILGGILEGDDIGEIAGNAGKSLLGPGAGLVGLADGGRAGFAAGGGYDPMAFAQMLQAHQAMYPGAGGRPGVGGESGPRGMQLHQGKQPQLMKSEHPKMPAQPETGMKSAMNDVGDAAKTIKSGQDIYKAGSQAYDWLKGPTDPLQKTGDAAAKAAVSQYGQGAGVAPGSITTQDNPPPAADGSTPEDYKTAGIASPAPADSSTAGLSLDQGLVPDTDVASSVGDYDWGSLFAQRGGRAARAPGGGIKGDIPYDPKGDGGYFPDDLDDPADPAKEMAEQKSLNNQNPQQKSGSGGGGGGAGDILGTVAKLAPLAMMFIKDGGRVGYKDGSDVEPEVELAEAPRGVLPVPIQRLREAREPEREYVEPRRPPPPRTEGVVPAPEGPNPERPALRDAPPPTPLAMGVNPERPAVRDATPEEKPYVEPRRPPPDGYSRPEDVQALAREEVLSPGVAPAPEPTVEDLRRRSMELDEKQKRGELPVQQRYAPTPPNIPAHEGPDAASPFAAPGTAPAAQAPGVVPSMPAPKAVGPTPGLNAPVGQSSGFDAAVARTFGHEGGFNARDANGAPVNMGINQAYHPNVDVSKLTKDQAREIYKTQYWDAIGGDQLDPKIQALAFDTAVISGVDRAKQFLAQSGGDPAKFLDLRRQFEEGLVKSDPAKYGKYAEAWRTRRNSFSGDSLNAPADSPQRGLGQPAAAASADPTAGLVPQQQPAQPDWLDRNEKYIVPALSFLGNMLASPSRTLAGSIGSGVVGAAQAYPTQQRIGQEQQRIGIAQNAQYIGIYNKLLEMANAQRVTNNGKVDPALQAQILHYGQLIGGGAGQALPAPGAGGVVPATQSGEPAPALPTMPKPVGPTDSTPDSLRIPQPDHGNPEFQSKLGDQYNPTKINEAAKGITDVNVARGQQATARDIQQRIAAEGFGYDAKGQPVYVPNWDQVTAYRDRVKTNPATIAQMDQENSRRRAAGEAARKITEVVKEFEPNMFADFKADLSRFLTSGGANPNKAFAQMNADAYYTFLKEAAGIVSAGGMGHTTDQARDTLKAAFTDPQMPPGAVRNVLAQFLGSVDRDNDFYNDVQKNIARVPGMNIQMRNNEFDKDKPLQGYVEKRHKDTPVRGDLPEQFTEKNVGSTYMMTPHEMLNRFPKDATINGKPITIDWVRDNMFGGATGDKPMRFRIDKGGKPVRDNG